MCIQCLIWVSVKQDISIYIVEILVYISKIVWAKGVFQSVRRSKVYKPEKVLEILESRDQKNKNKIKGKEICLGNTPMGAKYRRDIMEYSGVILTL